MEILGATCETVVVDGVAFPVYRRVLESTALISFGIGRSTEAHYRWIASDERRHILEDVIHPGEFKSMTHAEFEKALMASGLYRANGLLDKNLVVVGGRLVNVTRRHFYPDDRIGLDLNTENGAYYRFVADNDERYVFERIEKPGSFRAITYAELNLMEGRSGYSYELRYFSRVAA